MPHRRHKLKWKWFVHGDTATNVVIASRYNADEAAYTMVVCADGVRRDLWELDKPFLDRLVLDKLNLHLRFDIYVDDHDNGRPRLYGKLSYEPMKASA